MTDTSEAVATFANPSLGGEYRFQLTFAQSQTATSLLLPLGGPDVTAYFLAECQRYDAWFVAMKNRVYSETTDEFGRGLKILHRAGRTIAEMNHKKQTFSSNSCPCLKYAKNSVTISGFVFERNQIGNFLFAYMASRVNFSLGQTSWVGDFVALFANGIPDYPDDQAAYPAGYALGQDPGADFREILLENDVHAMQRLPHRRAWPCSETATGKKYRTYGATTNGWDPDPNQ